MLIYSTYQKCLVSLSIALSASAAQAQSQDFNELSIEQLLSVEVTSASRKTQNLSDVAAAIFVLTAEDIRRSGATSIPEALRMVPGVHVGRIDDNRWAVSARGFNDQYSNKLLVLMDGRHIYTPLFAGVYWDHHSLAVDNIERIEVIRGPGATLWGSNAVNGVINIISRSARDTQGVFLQARAGNNSSHSVAARVGEVTENGWYYRVDFNGIEEDFMESSFDPDASDYWRHHRSSVRLEGSPMEGHELMVDAAYYRGESKDFFNTLNLGTIPATLDVAQDRLKTSGEWLTVDWSSQDESGEGWQLKAYYDQWSRNYFLMNTGQTSLSIDFQSRHLLGTRHDVIWGFGFRTLDLPFRRRSPIIEQNQQLERFEIAELFVQDEIDLTEQIAITVGAKLEDSEFASIQFQPNVRLNWQISNNLNAWASISRAARTPSVAESSFTITPPLSFADLPSGANSTVPLGISIVGNKEFDSEWLTSYEAGLRGKISNRLDFDLAVFRFKYDDLRGAEALGFICKPGDINLALDPRCQSSTAFVATLIGLDNSVLGESTGAEFALQWQITENWRINTALSLFDFDLQALSSLNLDATYDEPAWIANVRSQWSIGKNMSLDITLRGVDESPVYNLDSYVTADVRFEWRPTPQWTLELIGQNLVDEGHQEYGSVSFEVRPSMVRRNIMARMTWAP